MIPFDHSIVETALQMAREAGAAQARIALERSVENSATVLDGRLDKTLSSSGSTLFIQLYLDGRYGSFSTNRLEESALREFIRHAAAAVRLITPDPCRQLPDPALCWKGPARDLQQYDPAIETLTPEARRDKALSACLEILGSHRRLLSVETEWGDNIDYSYTADSQGFAGETLQSNHTINANVSIRGRGDERPEAWWYESGIRLDEANPEGCGRKALQRALDQLHPRKLRSGRYDIVIDNMVASKVVSPLIRALSGGSLQQRSSFLMDRLGTQVFGENFTLTDDPFVPGLPGSRLFDGDGLATARREIIARGVVNAYFIPHYYALKMGIPATVDAPSVLRFSRIGENSEKVLNLPALLEQTGQGILITDFNGGNCNPSTGDFSYGIRGFRFEKGRIVHPVREMNITGNMLELWNHLTAVGDDPRTSSRWAVPSLAFEGVNFSGI